MVELVKKAIKKLSSDGGSDPVTPKAKQQDANKEVKQADNKAISGHYYGIDMSVAELHNKYETNENSIEKAKQWANVSSTLSMISGVAAAVAFTSALIPGAQPIAGVASTISLIAGSISLVTGAVAFAYNRTPENAISVGLSAMALIPGIPSRGVKSLVQPTIKELPHLGNFIRARTWSIVGGFYSLGY